MIVLDLRDISRYANSRSALYPAKAEAASVMLWKFHTEKVDQAQRGDYERPGFAVIARFGDALVLSEGWR